MKSKSKISKSSKAITSKAKLAGSAARTASKSTSKSASASPKRSDATPKLTTVKGAKAPKATAGSPRVVVAAAVSVTERLTASQGVKKAEVISIKSKALTLVSKTKITEGSLGKMPATKISRSEPSSPGSRVITGKFSVESTPVAQVAAKKLGTDKVGTLESSTSNAIVFKTGDKIVYPGHGVGEIEGIRTTMLGGQEHHIYNIKILDSGMKVMVPVSQASAVGLRKIVDKKAIDEVFVILKDRDFKIDTQTWNRRFREYSQKIKTGSVFEIAVVLRDLLVLSADKELSFGEKKMLDMAEGLLVSEIAIAKARPHDKVVGELRALFA